jgi:hypothetical protein
MGSQMVCGGRDARLATPKNQFNRLQRRQTVLFAQASREHFVYQLIADETLASFNAAIAVVRSAFVDVIIGNNVGLNVGPENRLQNNASNNRELFAVLAERVRSDRGELSQELKQEERLPFNRRRLLKFLGSRHMCLTWQRCL